MAERDAFQSMEMPSLTVSDADLDDPFDAHAVVALIDAYASDPIANGEPLSAEVKRALVPGLRAQPGAVVLLARRGADAVGIAVAFLGFSTFAARPLLNLHDIAVLPEHRGAGVGRRLLEAIEARARSLGCCKLTLEVQEGNARAIALYSSVGFAAYELDPRVGRAMFWHKKL